MVLKKILLQKTKDTLNRELYSSHKLGCEKLVINYSNKNNIKYYILRLFNTYGNKKRQFFLYRKIN